MTTVVGPAFVPPTQYSPIWNVIAALILVGALLIIFAVVRLTRAPRQVLEASDTGWMPALDRGELRGRYLSLIDDVESEYLAGRMPARDLHQRMSFLVREFAYEADGVRAPTMTLTDLRASRLHSLGDLVARLYPGEFAAVDSGGAGDRIDLARRVVRAWN